MQVNAKAGMARCCFMQFGIGPRQNVSSPETRDKFVSHARTVRVLGREPRGRDPWGRDSRGHDLWHG